MFTGKRPAAVFSRQKLQSPGCCVRHRLGAASSTWQRRARMQSAAEAVLAAAMRAPQAANSLSCCAEKVLPEVLRHLLLLKSVFSLFAQTHEVTQGHAASQSSVSSSKASCTATGHSVVFTGKSQGGTRSELVWKEPQFVPEEPIAFGQ